MSRLESRARRVRAEFLRIILQIFILSVVLLAFGDVFRKFVQGVFLNQVIFLILAWTIVIATRLFVIILIGYKQQKESYRDRVFDYWAEVWRSVFIAPITAGIMLLKFLYPSDSIVSDIIYVQTIFSCVSFIVLIVYMLMLTRRRFG